MVLTLAAPAFAQSQPQPSPQMQPQPSPQMQAQAEPLPPPAPSPYGAPPPVLAAPLPPPTAMPPPGGAADAAMSERLELVRSSKRQWTGARVMNGFAGAIGITSTLLSLTSAIYIGAAHYPPSTSDLTKPPGVGDPAQILSLVSSTSSAVGFGLSAGGLALRHHILRKLDADPGRGLFLSGTVVGLVGIAAIAAGYIVGFANIGNTHDQSIAMLSTSLGGSLFCNVATTMYAKDGSNLQKAWKNLTTF